MIDIFDDQPVDVFEASLSTDRSWLHRLQLLSARRRQHLEYGLQDKKISVLQSRARSHKMAGSKAGV